ncbi:helix-hairpin-helix domain-containing protein [Candidatus Thiosymbion oneisti]|uniref:helix-hairpin-helix domain-containing protein n=1 Tax=Candidatus Thiosymbion oneisti TaxID=589554 RepID=UPI000B7D898C|nr:helix-hairpin-helix domain-containing protein [Candidatus Thiosymbion oneisti]
MTTGKTTNIEELTKLAIDFVTTKKGLWDHAAWTDFMSSLQAKGFDLSGEMQTNLGNLLEAMRQFYTAAAATERVEKAVKTVVSDSVTFVKRHQGVWGHAEWEDFVKTVERNTLSLSEGTMAYLGGILESIKVFYALSPVGRVQKRLSAAPAETPPAPAPTSAAAEKTETKPAAAKPPEGAKVTSKAPPKRDDLTAIDGIGPTLAKKLNAAGISSYAQLAVLSDDDIERLEKDIIRFSGRIKRDDWVGQARTLSRGR